MGKTPPKTLEGLEIPPDQIGLPTGGAQVQVAVLEKPTEHLPAYYRVEGVIRPVDPQAPPIRFRVNLPLQWNGKAMHFGGAGYNGVVVSGTEPAPSAPPGTPVPLARGYATFGSDSGHQGANAAFALNDEALENFAYAALKKTRDVAVHIMKVHYGREPAYTYFVGSSQGGREGLMVTQRFPQDYDGVLSRVPVISFTGLQIASNRIGAGLVRGGWMNKAQIALLAQAQRALCDGRDGLEDGIISNYDACDFDPDTLRCPGGASAGDHCLSDAQIEFVRQLWSPTTFDFPLANGVTVYPGWPRGQEDLPGCWDLWVMGPTPPPAVQPPGTEPLPSLLATLGAQFIRYFIVRDPNFQTYDFDHNDPRWRDRLQEVSALVDATDPDLSAFYRRGGKLILVAHMADAQSPYALIDYYHRVVDTLGRDVADRFVRLYAIPGANHVGDHAPCLIDWVAVLEDWVERGRPPGEDLVFMQVDPVFRTRPACIYPGWPEYVGGDPNDARSFRCRTTGPA